MKKLTVKDLTVEEKLRLLCSNGFWHTMDFDGKLPSVSVSDGPVGLRAERKDENGNTVTLPSVSYPSAQSLANTWNVQCAELMGECLADDCYEKQTDILLGPGANVKRHPLNGRNFEYYSEDPLLAGEMARNYIEGVQSRGIGACLKHFCCNNLEYNRFEQSSEVDERTLREIYYVPFELGCKAKPVSMMCAYNRVNGKYASENKKGFTVLRDEFGFDGAIYSDWEAVRDRTASAQAGCDIEFPYSEHNYNRFVEDYRSGRITEAELDVCASRILDLIYRCKEMQKGKGVKRTVEQRLDAAYSIASESMVLLKNDGVLPLEKGVKIALSGCYAKPESGMLAGDGSSRVVALTDKFDLAELLKAELGGEVSYERMFYFDKVLGSNGETAVSTRPYRGRNNAAVADVNIICAGTGVPFEFESFDRRSMKLPVAQERAILDLAAVNPNTVVVLFAGSAIDVSAWADKVKAIVFAGFCGERGIDALCDVLCGKVNPSGKLSETFPVDYEASPVASEYIDAMVTCYGESLNVGYRFYDRHPQNIMYPFGYGLSYSKFEYSGLKLEAADGLDVTVKFDVENVSSMDGKEIAQVYVSEVSPVVYRPIKELKGFTKTLVKSGKKEMIEIKLDARAFSYYSVADDCWRVNDGIFKISVCSSSRDEKLCAAVEISNGKAKVL